MPTARRLFILTIALATILAMALPAAGKGRPADPGRPASPGNSGAAQACQQGDQAGDCVASSAEAMSEDTDGDGVANAQDTDDDGDGQSDVDEYECGSDPLDADSTSPDNDGDNSPDCVDPDDDNDGVLDADDDCPLEAGDGVDGCSASEVVMYTFTDDQVRGVTSLTVEYGVGDPKVTVKIADEVENLGQAGNWVGVAGTEESCFELFGTTYCENVTERIDDAVDLVSRTAVFSYDCSIGDVVGIVGSGTVYFDSGSSTNTWAIAAEADDPPLVDCSRA